MNVPDEMDQRDIPLNRVTVIPMEIASSLLVLGSWELETCVELEGVGVGHAAAHPWLAQDIPGLK